VIRRVIVGLVLLGVLALAALELASDWRTAGLGDPDLTETSERDTRLPVASELEEGGAVRPVLTR